MPVEVSAEVDNERSHHERCDASLESERHRLRSAITAAESDDSADGARIGQILRSRLREIDGASCPHFFGRLFLDDGTSLHLGRLGIGDEGDVLVSDWRAPAAGAFYRATAVDPMGVVVRRHYTFRKCELVAFADEDIESGGGGGLPDPLLAAISAERAPQMRDIAQTIQAEQDAIIRDHPDQTLLVDGGPGTGKTAVGLHRAAYIAYQWRQPNTGKGINHRGDVLVVGPNEHYIEYINNVLPSLGEREIAYRSYGALPPILDPRASKVVERRRILLLSPEILEVLEAYIESLVSPKIVESLRLPAGAGTVEIDSGELTRLRDSALTLTGTVRDQRKHFRLMARRLADSRNRSSAPISWSADAKRVLDAALKLPATKQVFRRLLVGDRAVWDHGGEESVRREVTSYGLGASYEYRVLWDEIRSRLDVLPQTYDHLVADEVQDLGALELRMLARRMSKSGSATLLGDQAQTTSPVGSWSDVPTHFRSAVAVKSLTTGYRVPEEVMVLANRLLDFHQVPGQRTVTLPGHSGSLDVVTGLAAVRDVLVRMRDEPGTAAILLGSGLLEGDKAAATELAELMSESMVMSATDAKGMEFDVVVYLDRFKPAEARERVAETYVALTRTVRHLVVGVIGMPPAWLAEGSG